MSARRWVILALLAVALAGFLVVSTAHAQQVAPARPPQEQQTDDSAPVPAAVVYWPDPCESATSWWDWWLWGCYL